jgi:hypothetical protein
LQIARLQNQLFIQVGGEILVAKPSGIIRFAKGRTSKFGRNIQRSGYDGQHLPEAIIEILKDIFGPNFLRET